MKKLFLIPIVIIVALIVYYYYPSTPLPKGVDIDQIVVHKSERKLMVYSKGNLIKTYKIALGFHPTGAKEIEKDGKTPEGDYFIESKAGLGSSVAYKNLGVSYPNAKDRMRARSMGAAPGGAIKIHGLVNGRGYIGRFHNFVDWTSGCMAVTNNEMDELYSHVKVGTPIKIIP